MARLIGMKSTLCVLVTLMLLSICRLVSAQEPDQNDIEGRDTVDIINQMSNGDISVRCKSGDNDLGIHIVTRDVDYNWRFHRNFWGTTLFYCTFVSPTGQAKTLDVWSPAVMKHSPCFGKCVWFVRPDGFYVTDYRWLNKPEMPPTFMVPWALNRIPTNFEASCDHICACLPAMQLPHHAHLSPQESVIE